MSTGVARKSFLVLIPGHSVVPPPQFPAYNMALLTWFPSFMARHKKTKEGFFVTDRDEVGVVGSEFFGPSAEIPLRARGDGNTLLLQLFTLEFPQTSRVGSS